MALLLKGSGRRRAASSFPSKYLVHDSVSYTPSTRLTSNAKLVRKLDISMNEIKSLEPGVFGGLERLRAVNIFGNPVQCVEIDPAALRRADGVQITCEA